MSITYPTADTVDQFAYVLLDQIVGSLTNPRKTFDHGALKMARLYQGGAA